MQAYNKYVQYRKNRKNYVSPMLTCYVAIHLVIHWTARTTKSRPTICGFLFLSSDATRDRRTKRWMDRQDPVRWPHIKQLQILPVCQLWATTAAFEWCPRSMKWRPTSRGRDGNPDSLSSGTIWWYSSSLGHLPPLPLYRQCLTGLITSTTTTRYCSQVHCRCYKLQLQFSTEHNSSKIRWTINKTLRQQYNENQVM